MPSLKRMNHIRNCLGLLALCVGITAFGQETLYDQNFEKADLAKVPEEFLVLDGAFTVVQQEGNRVLELPGAPLDTFGVLFGPTEKAGVAVEARVFGTSKGRRFPVIGVGLNGAVPIRLQSTPSKKALELFRGDDLLASIPFAWESGSWTVFRLQIVAGKPGEWEVSGKAWKQGVAEPSAWSITHILKEEPAAGKASVWGKPFSETPIRFDDLKVVRTRKS